MSIEQQVLEAMQKAGKPLRSGEIAELTGLDKKEVEKAIKKLKKEGKIESPKRCYYAPSG
ncbi:MAG TPA: HTH domain-containing protein [Persephonella sp.]|uniref:Conserved domain protein n=1 Tax=Persephonella marina (strain DSM 14350 / EX-H1) TaxID=123214 RepID=C0QQA6_PERMH|nr:MULTISPECIES: winged helix-turn-helix transcriptional regulator [Persephonella]ACO03469.1 conserved domain protein [Persephonella marina EX-H1]HCB69542.1 HTH domain-containing protein [Persephonella sp.]